MHSGVLASLILFGLYMILRRQVGSVSNDRQRNSIEHYVEPRIILQYLF